MKSKVYVRFIWIMLLMTAAFFAFGCEQVIAVQTVEEDVGQDAVSFAGEDSASDEVVMLYATSESDPTPAVEIALTPAITETPEPQQTEVPTEQPTEEPTPTAIAEPIAAQGSWTIEDRPFLLQIYQNGTFTAEASDAECKGTYISSGNDLTLLTSDDQEIHLKYYVKTDKLMLGDFVLIRSNIAATDPGNKISTTFRSEDEAAIITVRGAVVSIAMKNGFLVQEYCFIQRGMTPEADSCDWLDASDSGEPTAHAQIYKSDGSYTLWLRDTEGTVLDSADVDVVSGYHYPDETNPIEPARTALKKILTENRTTVTAMNEDIAADIAAAGMYSREAAVTAGISLISRVSAYNYSIIYQPNGSYQNESNWGVNPKWGDNLDTPVTYDSDKYYYCGMDQTSSVVWAYKQAGLNLVSGFGQKIERLGELSSKRDNKIDYDKAKPGDLIYMSSGKYLMVVDRLDRDSDGQGDAYLVFGTNELCLTAFVLPFSQIRSKAVYSMDAFFAGSGHNTDKTKYWKDTFRIPEEAMPQYLKSTIENERSDQAFASILSQFGF